MPRMPSANNHLGEESNDEFQSPDRDPEQTDYGLEFSSVYRTDRDKSSTNRSAQQQAPTEKPPTARKRTGGSQHFYEEARKTTTARQTSNAASGSQRRKANKPLRQDHVLKEIKQLQKSTKIIIPRLPFSRLVREILIGMETEVNRMTMQAMEALQESTEIYVTYQLQDAYTLTLHRGRVTLTVKDMELLRFLRGP